MLGCGSPCYVEAAGRLDQGVVQTAYRIFLWVPTKGVMTYPRDEMAARSPDGELVFLAKIFAGYQWSEGAEEIRVASSNDLGAFHLMLNQAGLQDASPQIQASAS